MGKKQAMNVLARTLENAAVKFTKGACLGFFYEPKVSSVPKKAEKDTEK